MAQSTCHSCKKVQLFLERMMYCSFCGTHYTDIEMSNAAQRIKQDKVIRNYKIGYFGGGILALFVIVPAILTNFVPNLQLRQNLGFMFTIVICFVWAAMPFAQAHAKKLYPEKSAE